MACGLSRSLNGQVIPSERPDHFMMEQWNPLGNNFLNKFRNIAIKNKYKSDKKRVN